MSSTGVNGFVDDKIRPISENVYGPLDPTLIQNSYLESKRMGENMCVSWNSQFHIPTKIARIFHTYGPGVKLDDGRVFADFISSVLKKIYFVCFLDQFLKPFQEKVRLLNRLTLILYAIFDINYHY